MSRLPAPENHPLPDIVVPYDDFKEVDVKEDGVLPVSDIPVTAPVLDNEPIVTRRELWSYYVRPTDPSIDNFCSPVSSCTITETTVLVPMVRPALALFARLYSCYFRLLDDVVSVSGYAGWVGSCPRTWLLVSGRRCVRAMRATLG